MIIGQRAATNTMLAPIICVSCLGLRGQQLNKYLGRHAMGVPRHEGQ